MSENYIDKFDDYSGQFNKKLEYDFKGDWKKLDMDEQELAALWKLIADVNNGGFIQFFCNWGYECYWYAMRGIQRIGGRHLLEMLHNTYMTVFDKFREDKRLKAYWDIPKYITSEDENVLMETDTSFWEEEGDILAETAYKYYHDTLKKQP